MKDLILLNANTGVALRWVPPTDFSFLQQVPLLPVQATEAGRLASALPLAFYRDVSQPSGWALMAVCGPESGLNAMVDGKGQWRSKVVPESIGYLPFAVKDLGGGKGLPGIDPRYASKVLLPGDTAVPLYGDGGQLHPRAKKCIEVLAEHQPKIRRTQDILSKLDKAELITPWPEGAMKAGGIGIEGLHTIDERKLAQLDDSTFLALRKGGALAVAYTCLLSLYQIRVLSNSSNPATPRSDKAVQSVGDLNLEFLNDSGTIKFGPLD